MAYWWFMKAMGVYAIWGGVVVEASVIIGLELGQMTLNCFTRKSCSPISVENFFKHAPQGMVDNEKSKSWKRWLD